MKKISMSVGALVLFGSALASFHATPFQLANLAYTGYLSGEGIPSYGALCKSNKTPSVSATEVVDAGILAGYVDEGRVTERYVSSVKSQLRSICDSGN